MSAFDKRALRRAPLNLAICAALLAPAIVLVSPRALAADPTQTYADPTFNDWGGTGLWQTPTARMAPQGEVAFTASHVAPYTRYSFLLQPFSWLQGTFRYSGINNRAYGAAALSGNQSYKDKSIDAKLLLASETRYRPALAVGIRDLGGTGLFSGEYVVASKRFGAFDASLGLGWGYLGARGDFENPLAILDSRFKTRPPNRVGEGGQFSARQYFRGPVAPFGGVSWQTPWQPLVVKLEYEGNNYRHEPLGDNQKQDSPINLGVVYRLNRHVDFSAAFERGNTALFGLTLHTDLAAAEDSPKPSDPPPPPRSTPPESANWAAATRELQDNAGLAVSRIAQRGRELVVTAEPTRYFYDAQGVGRMARVLDNYAGPEIDWFTLESTREGLPMVDTSVHRERFDALLDHRIDLDQFRRSVEQDPPSPQREQVLYRPPEQKFDGGLSLAYSQTMGGPNAFVLYEIAATYQASYHFTPNLWWTGQINANLLNNYDKFTYDAPSDLPRVRTHIREYLTSSRITMPVFQLTATRQLGSDWYAMAYGGMLEMMYGGVGGEVLYRPFGPRWALGADINWVQQRDFDQDFSFRSYHVVTGLATLYWDTGFEGLLMKLSAGRYLAGDHGATIDLSRQFRNGVRMGAYATFTNVDGKRYGEGSFDKGIYLSIPFDLVLPRSTRQRANILWEPLLRDGGARLNRQYTLYDLTRDRDPGNFNSNLDLITH